MFVSSFFLYFSHSQSFIKEWQALKWHFPVWWTSQEPCWKSRHATCWQKGSVRPWATTWTSTGTGTSVWSSLSSRCLSCSTRMLRWSLKRLFYEYVQLWIPIFSRMKHNLIIFDRSYYYNKNIFLWSCVGSVGSSEFFFMRSCHLQWIEPSKTQSSKSIQIAGLAPGSWDVFMLPLRQGFLK